MIRINIEKELLGDGGRFSLRLDLHIKKGEFVTLFGRSGSGKTTVLRMISGLEKPDRGKIEIDGKVYFDSEKGIDLPPQKRNIGFVFQNYALFPNMTVLENILFAMDRPDREKAIELLKTVHLEDLKDRYPDTLSGGQQQRVAVARALAREPSILLLDEPLSALDFSIREKLQEEIKRIHRVFNLTTILVSHDKTEVFKLSDRVVWIEKGRIIKEGSPRKVFIEKNISGKFSFIGNVLQIKKADTIYIATIEIGDNLVEVVLSDRDEISVGDKVIVSSKAFNPVVKKL
ncbi:MAG TPA: ABC transporter ATP-binding protein [Persephonella sp.]|uniref:Spermidine/putrescine import ATP-binding protein PotA n=1 Tax=Persephonella marina (strain DSM 14350 / EX-H1) TaxID=123214 RepID=C0QSN0_PERMH|nr:MULTISPECIES: ABC transporter ATP-binding protein [Persephonella]ACO03929.1 spermidine/putrescine import ATP-binding protein PotA [Persephonella marina EX-H1]HCB69423.1 ABC transporter ATP-binding protein [Persephonella sp.]